MRSILPYIRNFKKLIGFSGILIAVLIIQDGCRDTTINPDQLQTGYSYFPVDTGMYREYYVVDIKYVAGVADTSTWFYRETQKYWYLDQGGDSTLLIERDIRNDTSDAWAVDSLFRVKKNRTRVLVNENNVDYVKMVFPVRDSLSWNANTYNDLGEEDYRYQDVDKDIKINGLEFPSTMKVLQKEIDDPIVNYVKKDEIYADKIGMVYKESIDLFYCTDQDCLGQQIVLHGEDFRQQIIKYGTE